MRIHRSAACIYNWWTLECASPLDGLLVSQPKVSDEEKAQQRALKLERLMQNLFDSNKSTDPVTV